MCVILSASNYVCLGWALSSPVADHSARLNFGPRLEISLAVAFMRLITRACKRGCLERYWSVFDVSFLRARREYNEIGLKSAQTLLLSTLPISPPLESLAAPGFAN